MFTRAYNFEINEIMGSFIILFTKINLFIEINIHINIIKTFPPETMKYWVGVQWGQSYLMGEGASLALVGNPSSDGITIKMPYGVDVLH